MLLRMAQTSASNPKLLSLNLGHSQVGSYRYRSLTEGLYTLWALNSPRVVSLNRICRGAGLKRTKHGGDTARA